MGASNTYIYKVIICQALIDTIIGLTMLPLLSELRARGVIRP